MSLAVNNPVFSVPLRYLQSTQFTNDQVLTERSVPGLVRFVGDSENEIVRYLVSDQPLLATDWPMVFYGATGTGKTALALSVINQVLENTTSTLSMDASRSDVSSPVIFTAPDFVRRYHLAIDTNSIADFRSRIVNSPALLIDNLHLLADKPGAQDELVYLLDEMSAKEIPVVFTHLESPLSSSKLSGHLISRLSSGLSFELRIPGGDARAVIIRELAEIHRLEITEEAISWLSGRLKATAPQLNQFFLQLKAHIQLVQINQPLELEFFQSLLDNAMENRVNRTKTIIRRVASEFRIKTSDLKSNSRKQSVVLARGVAIYLCRTLLNTSFMRIGSSFGNRDHSTVMHAHNKITKILEADHDNAVQKTITGLRDKLSNEFSSQFEFAMPTENSSETS